MTPSTPFTTLNTMDCWAWAASILCLAYPVPKQKAAFVTKDQIDEKLAYSNLHKRSIASSHSHHQDGLLHLSSPQQRHIPQPSHLRSIPQRPHSVDLRWQWHLWLPRSSCYPGNTRTMEQDLRLVALWIAKKHGSSLDPRTARKNSIRFH